MNYFDKLLGYELKKEKFDNKVDYKNDIKTKIPSGFDKLLFINPSKFSTKTGNNFSPGKYGDLELYIMGLITIDELLDRKKNYILML